MKNVGYEIIKKAKINNKIYFVIGYNKNNEITPYVTWYYHGNSNFSMGHYLKTLRQANIDILKRIDSEIVYFNEPNLDILIEDVTENIPF